MRTKITTPTVLWVTIGLSIVFFLNRILPPHLAMPMQLVMIAVAVGVSVHIMKLPTFKRQ